MFKRLHPRIYLLVCLVLLAAVVPAVMAQDYCEVEPCEPLPPPPPPGDGEPAPPPPPSNPLPGPIWPGCCDGRMNPDPAEYYSIYCKPETQVIEVLRAVPPPTALIDAIPAAEVYNLPDGTSLSRASSLTVARAGDTITVSGNNGNLAPQEGSKTFSLQACLDSAGISTDMLAAAASNSVASQGQSDNPDVEPEGCTEEEWLYEDCRSLEEELIACLNVGWSQDPTPRRRDDPSPIPYIFSFERAIQCLESTQPGINGFEMLWLFALSWCGPNPFAVVLIPGGLSLLRRRWRWRKVLR